MFRVYIKKSKGRDEIEQELRDALRWIGLDKVLLLQFAIYHEAKESLYV